MKALRFLFLFLIFFLSFITIVFLQVNMVIKNTVLSSNYLSNSFDKNNLQVFLSQAIEEKVLSLKPEDGLTEDGSPRKANDENIPDMGQIIMKHLDKSWLENQLPILAKGVHSYIVADTEVLPVVDIKPLKEGFFKGLTEEMKKREEVKKSIKDLEAIIKVVDKKYKTQITKESINDALIDKISKSKELKNIEIDDKTFADILKSYAELNSSQDHTYSSSEMSDEIFNNALRNGMNFDAVKDTLDLNDLKTNIYITGENPITEIRELISAYKSTIPGTIFIILAFLLLITAVVGFQTNRFLHWSGISLLAGGLAGVIIAILGFNLPVFKNISANAVSSLRLDNWSENALALSNWLDSYINGGFIMFLIQGIVFSVTGVGLIAVGILYKRLLIRYKNNLQEPTSPSFIERSIRNHPRLVIAGRIMTVLILIAAISLTAAWTIKDFDHRIDNLNTAMQESNQSGNSDFSAALAKSTGASFLDKASQESKSTDIFSTQSDKNTPQK